MNRDQIPSFRAFTFNAPGRATEIIIPCGVSLPYVPQPGGTAPVVHQTTALWDTGATHCAITKEVADAVGLKPVGKAQIHGHAGPALQNVYLLNVYLPNDVVVTGVRATECVAVAGSFGMIVGMSIIARGDFAVTNVGGKTTVSFRIPSVATIDYTEEARRLSLDRLSSTYGRNDVVTISNPSNGEVQTLKFKHAQRLLEQGWEVVPPQP